MATFNRAKDASGNDVVRCFVKGAAPAVMARAATALAGGTSIPGTTRSSSAPSRTSSQWKRRVCG